MQNLFKLQLSLTLRPSYMEKKNPHSLDKATRDKISFITYIVPAFAEAYKMNVQSAFFYLKKYGGWDFLNKHWWTLHTESEFWAVRSLYKVCYRNGGPR